jgi:hypothetical protein
LTALGYEPRTAQRVGAIALIATALAIAGAVFLLDRATLGAPVRIRVLFRHAAGLRERAALVVAGQPIGRIEAISPVLASDAGLLAGQPGVAVRVAIDRNSAWKVSARAELFVASRGPLSDRYLEAAPPSGDPGPAIRDGQELRGIDPPSLDQVLARTWANLTTFHEFVAAVRPEFDALRAQLEVLRAQLDPASRPAGEAATATTTGAATDLAGGDTARALGFDQLAALASQTRELIVAGRHSYSRSLGGPAGLAELRAAIGDARQLSAAIERAVDRLGPTSAAAAADLERVRGQLASRDPLGRADHAIAAARAAVARLDPLLAALDELTERIASAEGSLGRLIADPEFSDDAKDLGKVLKRQPWKLLERPAN